MTPRAAVQLLKGEIVQVVGCTEPAAIAYAFRTLVLHMPFPPGPGSVFARLYISLDAFRNASTAVVPHLKKKGILAAAAAGLASRANDFNVFSNFDLKLARAYLKNTRWLRVVPIRRNGLYVMVRLNVDTGIVLRGRHDHIEKLVVHGEDLTPSGDPLPKPPALDEIFNLPAPVIQVEPSPRFSLRQVPAEKGFPLETQIARRVAGRMAGYSHLS